MKVCPLKTCNTPLGIMPVKIVFDRTIQSIVDKIFPQFVQEESSPRSKKVKLNDEASDNSITVRVLPTDATETIQDNMLPSLSKPLLIAKPNVTVSKVQKFISKRLLDVLLIPYDEIEVLYRGEVLKPEETLEEIRNRNISSSPGSSSTSPTNAETEKDLSISSSSNNPSISSEVCFYLFIYYMII
jgi:hypothetical protein